MNIYSQFFEDMKKYKSYMVYATKSELKSEVADSYLNWVWWILEPPLSRPADRREGSL